MPRVNPLVSVIVPTLNSSESLPGCLKSLAEQTYENVELIVVDNHSEDGTRGIARRFGGHVFVKGPERSAQVNYGVRKANGEFVFFTGADMVVDRNYIEQAVRKCDQEGYDAIYASVLTTGDEFWARVKGLERQTYVGDDSIESARFFRRKVFLELGGYDESLGFGGDDYDMQRRLDAAGFRTGRIKAFEWHTDESTSLRQVFRKAVYYTSSLRSYVRKHPKHSLVVISPVRPAFIRHYRLFLRHPVLSAGFAVFKSVQGAGAATGVLLSLMPGRNQAEKIHGKVYRDRSLQRGEGKD